MTKECLDLFIKNINYPTKILLINNQTNMFDMSDIELNKINNYKKINSNFLDLIIRNENENLGFLGGTNLGYQLTKGKYILLLNNDAMCKSPFLKEYVSEYKKDIGIIGPSKLKTEGITFLEDSCIFFSREFKDNILGDMDMDFGIGIMEDVLYSYRCLYCGYKILHKQFDYQHLGSQTLNMERKIKQTEINRQIYRDKVFNIKSEKYKELHDDLNKRIKENKNGK
jgi:hypothetical protein